MRSSNRQQRYRRRFQTLTRSRRQLLLQIPDPRALRAGDGSSSWATLCRSLCLKSAQEVGASREGMIAAANLARRVIEKRSEETIPFELHLSYRD